MSKVTPKNEVVTPNYLTFSKVLVWLMYFWVMIGVVALSLRVFLLAFSANMSAGFAEFVSNVSSDYMEPFRGLFSGRSVGDTGYLDVSALFAIIVYLFIAWGFKALIEYIELKIAQNRASQLEAIRKEERQRAMEKLQRSSGKTIATAKKA